MNSGMTLQHRSQAHLNRMDWVVRAAEIKWGMMGGLESLVPPNLAAKFALQWGRLSEAIMANAHEDVIVLADGVVRGIWALERVAVLAGAEPSPLPGIGLETPLMAPERVSEYVPSGLPMDQEIPW